MKLLFDQNLSHKILLESVDINSCFPDSSHVRDFNLQTASDADIWDFAKTKGFTIISKDSDFHQRSLLFGHPPKVICLKVGNISTNEIKKLLRDKIFEIAKFVIDLQSSLLILE